MFHGGTNFGFLNGANQDNDRSQLKPDVTNYGESVIMSPFSTTQTLSCLLFFIDYGALLSEVLKAGASFNLYMFQGGTNFGFMNGATQNEEGAEYNPDVTNYGRLCVRVWLYGTSSQWGNMYLAPKIVDCRVFVCLNVQFKKGTYKTNL